MKKVTGTIFNIQRFSLNDGPGIRTIVFLKGCPLNCAWCHNPESKSPEPKVFLNANLCIGCGECAKVCLIGAHSFTEDGKHNINRDACVLCGKCVKECIGALEICGKKISAGEAMEEIMRDKLFYDHSGGGLTISGGEPLFQIDFTHALLALAKENGLNTCVETCGFADHSKLERIVDLVDIFLYDLKETDASRHKEYTGVSNAVIFENLFRLDERGAKIVLRCPIIPGYNDRIEHLEGIASLANSLKKVERIDISPYHPLGESKSEAIGKEYPLKGLTFPDDETIKGWIAAIAAKSPLKVQKT